MTNRRVIALQDAVYRRTAFIYVDKLPALKRTNLSGTIGTLRFTNAPQGWLESMGVPQWERQAFLDRMITWEYSFNWEEMTAQTVPVLVDVEDVHGVYELIARMI